MTTATHTPTITAEPLCANGPTPQVEWYEHKIGCQRERIEELIKAHNELLAEKLAVSKHNAALVAALRKSLVQMESIAAVYGHWRDLENTGYMQVVRDNRALLAEIEKEQA